jgi:hypothetical protein
MLRASLPFGDGQYAFGIDLALETIEERASSSGRELPRVSSRV